MNWFEKCRPFIKKTQILLLMCLRQAWKAFCLLIHMYLYEFSTNQTNSHPIECNPFRLTEKTTTFPWLISVRSELIFLFLVFSTNRTLSIYIISKSCVFFFSFFSFTGSYIFFHLHAFPWFRSSSLLLCYGIAFVTLILNMENGRGRLGICIMLHIKWWHEGSAKQHFGNMRKMKS